MCRFRFPPSGPGAGPAKLRTILPPLHWRQAQGAHPARAPSRGGESRRSKAEFGESAGSRGARRFGLPFCLLDDLKECCSPCESEASRLANAAVGSGRPVLLPSSDAPGPIPRRGPQLSIERNFCTSIGANDCAVPEEIDRQICFRGLKPEIASSALAARTPTARVAADLVVSRP